MDIVDRIKLYIKHSGITISQFADTCEIPRPTVSQLLNGRNKKVSDEIFRKIHLAYPLLSINWLMFGEGEMTLPDSSRANEDGASSAAHERAQKINFTDDVSEILENRILDGLTSSDLVSESDLNISDTDRMDAGNIVSMAPQVSAQKNSQAAPGDAVSPSAGPNPRKIVNILVFYSDSSFEYFYPSSHAPNK
ncbi:MAG: helix-turn-helix domain-containing protein [Muribaculaceae bacterium]